MKPIFYAVIISVLLALHFPVGAQQTLLGQSGSSVEDPVVLKDLHSFTEINTEEQKYLAATFGTRNEDWILYEQDSFEADTRHYDKITVKLTGSGELRVVYFDITQSFEKFSLPVD